MVRFFFLSLVPPANLDSPATHAVNLLCSTRFYMINYARFFPRINSAEIRRNEER